MAPQVNTSFADELRRALKAARLSQADLARRLSVDPGQVSRWINGKAVPHIETLGRIEEELGADLTRAFEESTPTHELYVSTPITGLEPSKIGAHHDTALRVVDAARAHVNSMYWPGEEVRERSDIGAADLTTERNMSALAHCPALLYLQFDEIVHPCGALIELGLALGRRMKTTIISLETVPLPAMLAGFDGVAASISFLPRARIYRVPSVEHACELVRRNGRELLGLS